MSDEPPKSQLRPAETEEQPKRNWLQVIVDLPWLGVPITLAVVVLPVAVGTIGYAVYFMATHDVSSYSYSLASDPDAKTKTTVALIVLFAWVFLLERMANLRLSLPIPFVSISYKWLILLMLAVNLGLCSGTTR
ncbi:MAG: hypothetical protein AB1452_16555 [Pseudomonadota bacterium]